MIHDCPPIKQATPLKDYQLLVEFTDGYTVLYDVKKDIQRIPEFEQLVYIYRLFQHVKVDTGGGCVYWNDMVDIPHNRLYLHGKPIVESR